jgi:imidazolonepropionase-like amidohydrolase
MITTRRIASTLFSLALAAGAAAQSREIPAAPQKRPVVIAGGTVHTVSGDTIENGWVHVERGVIEGVGAGRPPQPKDAEVVDARGMHLYPGLIAASTTLGLTETGAVPVTNDHTELGSFTPEVRAAVAMNPDSDLIPVTRANGILTALVEPRGGLVAGRAAIVRLDGWTWEDLAIDGSAGLVVNWPRTDPITAPWMSRNPAQQRKEIEAELKRLDEIFDDAAAYVAARAHDASIPLDLRYEAMRPALAGERPLLVHASSAGQIESAVAWCARRSLRCVIIGGSEADRAAGVLTKHDVPVVITGLHRLPSGRQAPYDEPFTLPARLRAAGVRFAIASGAEAAHERNLNHNAATAAAFGLDKADALKAVTLWPAQILGVGDRLGSIERGKSATLILTTGDPLEIVTDVLAAYVDGRRIDLGNRQKALYAKYREKYRQLGIIDGETERRAERPGARALPPE